MTQTSALGHGEMIRRFLDRLVGHDWAAVAECLTDDVVRTGPYGDTYTPREAYVSFLADLMPRLANYSMKVRRVMVDGESAVGLAELSETLAVDGAPLETPEALVFDFAEDGRIARISIYTQQGVR